MIESTAASEFLRTMLSDPVRHMRLKNAVAPTIQKAPPSVDGDDLFQAMIVNVLKGASSFRGKSEREFLSWIRVIAERCLADSYRDFARQPTYRSLECWTSGDSLADSSAALEREELVALIQTRLKPAERLLLEARYGAGLTFAQIARIINTSPEAARQKHHRLLKQVATEVFQIGESD